MPANRQSTISVKKAFLGWVSAGALRIKYLLRRGRHKVTTVAKTTAVIIPRVTGDRVSRNGQTWPP